MATKKGGFWNFVPFGFAFCAAVLMLVACGDDSSGTSADQYDNPSSDSNNPSEMVQRSSSSWTSFYSSIGTIYSHRDSVNTRDSLGDTVHIADSISDTSTVSLLTKYNLAGVTLDKFAAPFFSMQAATTLAVGLNSAEAANFTNPLVKVSLAGVALAGAATQNFTLTFVADLSESEQVEANLFKHLQAARALAYMQSGVTEYAEASGNAAIDVWKAFRLPEIAADAPQESQDGANLALHVMLSQRMLESGVAFLDSLTSGIAKTGDWTDSLQRISIADWALEQDATDGFAAIRADITASGLASAPEFEYYLRAFYRAVLGLDSCGADNMDSLFFVGNKASRFYAPAASDYTQAKERFACRAEGIHSGPLIGDLHMLFIHIGKPYRPVYRCFCHIRGKYFGTFNIFFIDPGTLIKDQLPCADIPILNTCICRIHEISMKHACETAAGVFYKAFGNTRLPIVISQAADMRAFRTVCGPVVHRCQITQTALHG